MLCEAWGPPGMLCVPSQLSRRGRRREKINHGTYRRTTHTCGIHTACLPSSSLILLLFGQGHERCGAPLFSQGPRTHTNIIITIIIIIIHTIIINIINIIIIIIITIIKILVIIIIIIIITITNTITITIT
jgi:hypothetical protein